MLINERGTILKKILLINDSVFENAIMRDTIESIGYEVKISNEFEALGTVDQFQPDIVISNYIMKRITGDKLLQKMKKENSDIVTILSSSSKVKMEDIINSNIDFIIQTPIKKEALEKLLLQSKKSINKYNYCPACGENLMILNITTKFCPYCGNKL